MSTTKNLGITLVDENEDMPVLDWVKLVNGTELTSMAKIVDTAFGNKEVYSDEEPPDQKKGDTWYKVLTTNKEG